jgi:hypothetical protein
VGQKSCLDCLCRQDKFKGWLCLGCLSVFGQKARHAPITALEKLDTLEFKAFSKKIDPKKHGIMDLRRDILQKSGTVPLKSAQIDSLVKSSQKHILGQIMFI